MEPEADSTALVESLRRLDQVYGVAALVGGMVAPVALMLAYQMHP